MVRGQFTLTTAPNSVLAELKRDLDEGTSPSNTQTRFSSVIPEKLVAGS